MKVSFPLLYTVSVIESRDQEIEVFLNGQHSS